MVPSNSLEIMAQQRAGILLVFLLVALTFFVVMLRFMIIAVTRGWRLMKIGGTFESIAHRYSGDIHRSRWFQFPKVIFENHGHQFYLQAKRVRGFSQPRLQVSTQWPDRKFRLSLTPESFSSKFRKLIGLEDYQVGDSEFDKSFIVQTNNTEALDRILTDQARETLVSLLRMDKRSSFNLQIVGGQVTWQKIATITDAELVTQIVEQFVEGIGVMLPRTGGDNVMSDEQAIVWLPRKRALKTKRSGKRKIPPILVEVGEPVCLICGTDIVTRRVECRSCKTPHHRECWEYFGMCSTYACGQTRFRNYR